MWNNFLWIAVGMALSVAAVSSPSSADPQSTPAGELSLSSQVLPWVGKSSASLPCHLLLQKGGLVVAIGDSITAKGNWLRSVESALSQLYPDLQLPQMINAGGSGHTAKQLLDRFPRDVLDRNPAVVILNVGINDVLHAMAEPSQDASLRVYREHTAAMVDQAHARGIKVILLTPTLIEEDPESKGNRILAQYADVMKSVGTEKKCDIADLHAMFLEALQHKPSEIKGDWITSDGIHMSPLGNAVIQVGVLRAIGVPDVDIVKLK